MKTQYMKMSNEEVMEEIKKQEQKYREPSEQNNTPCSCSARSLFWHGCTCKGQKKKISIKI